MKKTILCLLGALAIAGSFAGCTAEEVESVSVGTQVIAIDLAPSPAIAKLAMVEATEPPKPIPKPTDTPVPTATPAPTAVPTATPTPEPTATATPKPTIVIATAKPTQTPKATNTPTPKPAATPTQKPTAEPTPTATANPTPTPIISDAANGGDYSADELELAARVAYWEARGKGEDAYRAVLCVILNRCESDKFGGGLTSISTEVYRKSQFSVVRYDDFLNDRAPDSVIRYANDVFNNKNRPLPEGVLFFRSASLGESWDSKEYYDTIGGNAFFYAG